MPRARRAPLPALPRPGGRRVAPLRAASEGLATVERFRARGHLAAGLDPLLRSRGTMVPKVVWWDAARGEQPLSQPGGASSSTGRPAGGASSSTGLPGAPPPAPGAGAAEGGGRARGARRAERPDDWLFVGPELRHAGRGAWWRRDELLGFLRDTYTGSIGFEANHLVSDSERRWWHRAAERWPAPWLDPPKGRRRQLIKLLLRASLFTEFLKMKFPTSKFFGLHGIEALIPGLYRLCRRSATHGVENVELGLAHRGRLSIQANLLGKPMGLICAEMQENVSDFHVGDVKYHTGFEGVLHGLRGVEEDPDQLRVRVRITPNPSHLEAVGPVVVGRVRAMHDALGGGEEARRRVVGVVVHGDAALSGLGVPFECMNLARLDGYETGGTIHIVLNNQIGFTTAPHQGRSTPHPSDLAKAMDVPVLHVNADDVEAVDHAFSLAADWRAEFGRDVVVDLVGYRRYGHNELDQPDVYYPMSYARVREHKMVAQLYGAKLVESGAVAEEDIADMRREVLSEFEAQYAEMIGHRQSGFSWLRDNYAGTVTLLGRKDPFEAPRQPTGVPLETLCRILTACTTPPEGFSLHPTVAQMLEKRRRMATEGPGVRVDFATAEMLAFATIVLFRDVWAPNRGSGAWHVPPHQFLAHRNIRLSGQDSTRGTFSQRHAVIHDMRTGAEWRPLESMAPGQQARFSVLNSPLSEMAVMAFEYGYSVTDSQTLVCWEAQFGDFANNAQVAIDQFIASGEEKWGQGSSIVLLLPHGYDGQGPDHSSARLERFLQLVNDDPDHLPGTSPREVRDIERAFDVLDKTKNGFISKEEVMDYLSDLQKANLTETRTAEEVWAEVTSELSGADHERRGINRRQWRQIMTTWLRRHAEEQTNLFVVNVSTPAQYFHCLRRHAHMPYRKPLVVMAPKYLLHHAKATSALEDFGPGQFFRQVIVDYNPQTSEYAGLGDNTRHLAFLKSGAPAMESPKNVRRLIICSGQMYYTLSNARRARKIRNVALLRLEQIAPFPHDRITEAISFYPSAEVMWCQEEPKNMGAWFYVRPRLQTALILGTANFRRHVEVQYVGRPVSAVTATGSPHIHQAEQKRIVDAAFSA